MRLSSSRTNLTLAAVGLASVIAGCGGGGSSPMSLGKSSPTVAPTSTSTTAPSSSTQYANVTFTIKWPTVAASSSSIARRAGSNRKPEFVSPSTKSISIAVNGATPTVVANPNVGGGTTATAAPSTTIVVQAPVGNDTFFVNDYDTADTSGNVLAKNTISYTVVMDQANVIPITLNGDLAKIVCSGVAPYTSPVGTIAAASPQAFTITGPAGQVAVVPEDADSNIIVAPGATPSPTLTAAPAQALVSSANAGATYVVNPLTVGTAVSLNASGQSLNAAGTSASGATVTGSCTVTRQLAMYVANHYENNLGSSSAAGAPFVSDASVTVYPVTATGSATPIATIQGANTLLTEVYFPLVDNNGNVFVSNQGPMPGTSFTLTSGYVSIYGPATYGNTAPIATIAHLGEPQGLAFDPKGNLFVSEVDRIEEYPPTANGVRAAAVPSNTIIGSATDLGCYGLAVDANEGIYAPCGPAMFYYPPSAAGVPATGNVSPGAISAVGTVSAAGMTLLSTQSWNAVSIDPTSGDFALPGWNNNANQVSIYTPSQLPAATTPITFATPVPTLSKDVQYSQPYGIAVDPNGQYYVTDFGSSAVDVFSSETVLDTGIGTHLTLGGLNKPYGITVR